jgi:hypothetical protein
VVLSGAVIILVIWLGTSIVAGVCWAVAGLVLGEVD